VEEERKGKMTMKKREGERIRGGLREEEKEAVEEKGASGRGRHGGLFFLSFGELETSSL